MKTSALFAMLTLFILPGSATAEWEARVVHTYDGDTLITSRGGRAEIISLFGVDSPEMEQPFGPEARSFTSGLVTGKIIRVVPIARGRYEMCKVYMGDKSLNEELLRAGYAWHNKDYSEDEEWAKMELNARSAGRGLWSQEHPAPPWEFREGSKKESSRDAVTIKFQGRHESFSSGGVPAGSPSKQPARRRRK